MSYQGTGRSREVPVTKLTSNSGARPKSSEKTISKKPKLQEPFYENLTLGLKNTLSSVPRICDIRYEMRQPCEKAQLVNWEQRHSVYLPEDMKKFYLSTDGFTLHWSYQYATDDTRRVGLIHFPHLLQITLLRENVETNTAVATSAAPATICSSPCTSKAAAAAAAAAAMPSHKSAVTLGSKAFDTNGAKTGTIASVKTASQGTKNKDLWGNPIPVLTPKSKIFELNNINEVAKVCLVYESTNTSNPKIYLLELNDFRWQFLSESFSEYLRMAIAHLGLPYWELCFSSFGLPSWAEQLFLLLAPHLLEDHEKRRGRIINPANEHPYNMVDPNIFRVKPKCVTKTSTCSTSGKYK